MLNQMQIIGRITDNITVNKTPNGASVANVSVAVNEKKKQGDQWVDHAEFINCTLWNKTAELAGQFLSKGSMVYFSGKLETQKSEKDGVTRFFTKVVVRDMKFLPSGQNNQGQSAQNGGQNQAGFAGPNNNANMQQGQYDNIGQPGATASGNIPF